MKVLAFVKFDAPPNFFFFFKELGLAVGQVILLRVMIPLGNQTSHPLQVGVELSFTKEVIKCPAGKQVYGQQSVVTCLSCPFWKVRLGEFVCQGNQELK